MFNIRADTFGAVGSVKLRLSGGLNFIGTENVDPYALFGDKPRGNYYGRSLPSGDYTIMAQAYPLALAEGAPSSVASLNFTIPGVRRK